MAATEQQPIGSALTIPRPGGPRVAGSRQDAPQQPNIEVMPQARILSNEDEFVMWSAQHLVNVIEVIPRTNGQQGVAMVSFTGDIPNDKVLAHLRQIHGLMPYLRCVDYAPNRRATDVDEPIIVPDDTDTESKQAGT